MPFHVHEFGCDPTRKMIVCETDDVDGKIVDDDQF